MNTDLKLAIEILSRGPAAYSALLRGAPDTWVRRNEGGDSWDAYGIVAHLVALEHNDWMPRILTIMESSEVRTFAPIDRTEGLRLSAGKSLDDLLDEFSTLRSENLSRLASLNLGPADMVREARHPTFGPVTLSQLIATWVVHDQSHLHQLSRVLANQYRDAVGPWARFLGVLHCDGHSEQA